jgi:hypothetical protein
VRKGPARGPSSFFPEGTFWGIPVPPGLRDHADEGSRRMSGVAAFEESFDVARAERLLWRAGFGPRKGEAEALARLGLDGAVHALTYPDREKLVGPAPKDDKGRPLAPYDAWGHDHAWWLDRMVRTSRPLVERMSLVWHDWFATSNDGVGSQRLMLDQNQLFRAHALGGFSDLLLAVTRDPAMLLWLNGSDNSKSSPNENYAREMLELFTLSAGRGYTESDVRQNARALTGFRSDWKRGVGSVNFRYDAEEHDAGTKTIFKKHGAFTWNDSVKLAVSHPLHPPSSRASCGATSSRRLPTRRHSARSSVFLEGGADALSVLSPRGDPLYKKLRPHLALSGGPTFTDSPPSTALTSTTSRATTSGTMARTGCLPRSTRSACSRPMQGSRR